MANSLLSPQAYANAMMQLLKDQLILGSLLNPKPRNALCEVVAEGLGLNIEDVDIDACNRSAETVRYDVLYGINTVKIGRGK